MPSFSAKMTFTVSASGLATVKEERLITPDDQQPLTLEPYSEILPASIVPDTFQIYLARGNTNTNRVPMDYELQDVPGTNRRRFRVPKAPKTSFDIGTQPASLVTEFSIGQFFDAFNQHNLYTFHFHHSLPACPYLRTTVPKTIIVNWEKPSPFLFSWDALFIFAPANEYETALTSFGKQAVFQFSFDISPNQHYFNSVVLRRRFRFNIIPPLWRLMMSFARKEGDSQ